MRILVIGGMHGNEPLGIDLVSYINKNPIGDVDTLLANEQATKMNCRFTSADLNRSFPGDAGSREYEKRRASDILAQCGDYDVVLDFHNTHCPANDCGFVGESAMAELSDVAAWLGLKRIIVADYDCTNKYAPNCLSVEISLDSPDMKVPAWYERISKLAALQTLPAAKDLEIYRFVYRMTLEDRDRLNLPAKNIKAFESIDARLAAAMAVTSPAYPIFVNDAYTPYNYGGLLNRIH